MNYISERITNIAELEEIIEEIFIMVQVMQKESPQPENFQNLINKIENVREFEFHIERRGSEMKNKRLEIAILVMQILVLISVVLQKVL